MTTIVFECIEKNYVLIHSVATFLLVIFIFNDIQCCVFIINIGKICWVDGGPTIRGCLDYFLRSFFPRYRTNNFMTMASCQMGWRTVEWLALYKFIYVFMFFYQQFLFGYWCDWNCWQTGKLLFRNKKQKTTTWLERLERLERSERVHTHILYSQPYFFSFFFIASVSNVSVSC